MYILVRERYGLGLDDGFGGIHRRRSLRNNGVSNLRVVVSQDSTAIVLGYGELTTHRRGTDHMLHWNQRSDGYHSTA